MEKAWRDDQLRRINNGTSIFAHIPAEIGRVVYCDSTTGKTNETHSRQKRSFFGSIHGKFTGVDYLVGEKGFARISFEDSRDSVVAKTVILYDDIAYVCTYENTSYQRNSLGLKQIYAGSTCSFYFYDAKAGLIGKLDGKFWDDKAHFANSPKGADEEYLFLKRAESEYTKRFRYKHLRDEPIQFPMIGWDGSLYSCVDVYPDSLRLAVPGVKDLSIKFSDLKTALLDENNELIINQTTTIDYSRLANGKALMQLITERANGVITDPWVHWRALSQRHNYSAIIGFIISIAALVLTFIMPALNLLILPPSVILSLLGLRKKCFRLFAIAALYICVIAGMLSAYLAHKS